MKLDHRATQFIALIWTFAVGTIRDLAGGSDMRLRSPLFLLGFLYGFFYVVRQSAQYVRVWAELHDDTGEF